VVAAAEVDLVSLMGCAWFGLASSSHLRAELIAGQHEVVAQVVVVGVEQVSVAEVAAAVGAAAAADAVAVAVAAVAVAVAADAAAVAAVVAAAADMWQLGRV
jgi:hypothetical protein